MRLFIYKTGKFLLLFIGIMAFIFWITGRVIEYFSDFSLDQNDQYLVLGNSHPEYAFNDSLLPNFKNLGHSGEAYLYTYTKVKKVIEGNPQIKRVYIEFGNTNIGEKSNNWTWEDRYLNYRYPIYSPYLDFSDRYMLFKNNPLGFAKVLPVTLKIRLIQIAISDYQMIQSIGGFKSWNQTMPDSLIKVSPEFKIRRIKDYMGISEISLNYMDKTIQYCKEHNVEPILIRSPIHNNFNGYYNELLFQQILKSRYNSVKFLDFSKYPINDDEIGDYRHLNHLGSQKFSLWFNQLLENGLLDSINPQGIIDREIDLVSKEHLN